MSDQLHLHCWPGQQTGAGGHVEDHRAGGDDEGGWGGHGDSEPHPGGQLLRGGDAVHGDAGVSGDRGPGEDLPAWLHPLQLHHQLCPSQQHRVFLWLTLQASASLAWQKSKYFRLFITAIKTKWIFKQLIVHRLFPLLYFTSFIYNCIKTQPLSNVDGWNANCTSNEFHLLVLTNNDCPLYFWPVWAKKMRNQFLLQLWWSYSWFGSVVMRYKNVKNVKIINDLFRSTGLL